MSVTRTYSCNLCRETKELGNLIGLFWTAFPKGWEERAARDTEHHICTPCLSGLQAMSARCGQGYECRGGPKCGSDHK